MAGQMGRDRFVLMGVTMSVPRTLAKRSTDTTVAGLSSAKSRTNPSTSSRERSTRVRAGDVRAISSRNQVGSVDADPYTRVDDFTTTWRTGEPDCPAAARRFMVPMTLISCRARLETRVESTTRKVWTMVSTWVAADDAGQDRIRLVGLDEFGPLERDGGLACPHAQDHVHVGVRFEGLGHPAAPERVEAGDEDASPHRRQPNQTLRRSRSIS